MRTLYSCLSILAFLFSSEPGFAQQTKISTDSVDLKINYQAEGESRAQNVFVELGGQGLLFTANYDTRFNKRRDGIGGRVGIGYLAADGHHVTTVPISMNYLLGKSKHLFEIGLGATLINTSGDGQSFFFDDQKSSNVIGTMSFAYRLQPVESGFSFRAGLTPIFKRDFFIPYYGGISLGYTF